MHCMRYASSLPAVLIRKKKLKHDGKSLIPIDNHAAHSIADYLANRCVIAYYSAWLDRSWQGPGILQPTCMAGIYYHPWERHSICPFYPLADRKSTRLNSSHLVI